MRASPAWTDPAAFVEHASWVRGLAARLARDADEADELEQETWLAFLRAPLAGVRSPRRFLAGILRHRRRVARRAEARRVEHEVRAASERRGPAGPASEALEKAELARALVELVLELEEPYRSAILLRYVEELAPLAVAERLGVPPRTAEARISRGLARLRERWRRRHGEDGTRWLSALLLLARPTVPAAVPAGSAAAVGPAAATGSAKAALAAHAAGLSSLGVLLVNTKLVLALLAAAGGGGILWLWSSRSPEPAGRPPARTEAAADPGRLAGHGETPSAPAAESAARTALAADPQQEPAPATAESAAPVATLRGRVLDPEARPLAGIELQLAGNGEVARTTSGPGGAFELVAPPFGDLSATDPSLETLVAARLQGRSDAELLIVVAPYRSLAGIVVDDAGRPLGGARVRLELPAGFMGRFSTVLDHALNLEWAASTERDGRFAFARAPLVAGLRVTAALDGYRSASIEAPALAAVDLAIVLERPELDEGTLAGRVVDPERAPAAGALVALGGRVAQADERGEFRIALDPEAPARELVALKQGHLPTHLEAEIDPTTGAPLFPAWIELVLGAEPRALAGRVVDERGEPRAGIYVWIADPTFFGELADETHVRTEFLLAQGAESAGEFYQSDWSAALTDDAGRFVVPGLLERAYALVLYDAERVERLEAGSFEAGREDLELLFPRGALTPLAIRLVSGQGAPLPEVHVFLEGETYGGVWKQAGSQRSDADGRVVFQAVGNGRVSLLLRGERIVPLWHFFPERPAGEAELVLTLRCNAKVELADPARADAVRVLDAEDNPLDLYEIGATGVTYVRQLRLVDGRSITFGVSESAHTLVLEKEDVEVERLPLRLLPDRLNVIGP
jgi:RNA polymerase sigma-70 factor (ECF subfamily)